MLHRFIARIDARDVHLVGHVSNEELTAYYEIADVFVSPASTKASACRWSSRSTWACRCWRMPPPRCRRRWMAPACLHEQGSDARRRADQRGGRRSRDGASGSSTASTRRSIGSRPRTLRARCCGHIDSVLASPRREHPPVAFDFWDQVDAAPRSSTRSSSTGRRRFSRCRAGNREPGPEPDACRSRLRSRIPAHDRQPVGPGGAQGRRDRRLGPPRPRAAA